MIHQAQRHSKPTVLNVTPATRAQTLLGLRTDSERRLTKRCRELGAELVGSAAKVAAALRLSEDDAAAIKALKAEIEKAWRLVDASAEKARRGPHRPTGRASGSPARVPAQAGSSFGCDCRRQARCTQQLPVGARNGTVQPCCLQERASSSMRC